MRVLVFFALLCGSGATAQQVPPARDAVIHTVTHVDFMPNHLSAITALDTYVAQERKDPGVQHVELLQSMDAPNHFTLLETFQDRDAYNRHVEAAYTRLFRAGIAEFLGSPYNERLFHEHAVE